MTQMQWAAVIAGVCWAIAALATLLGADGKVAPTFWYAGWSVLALFYALQ